MGLDADLVGVIVACTAVGFCLCVVVVLVGCVCYRRLEKKRRKFEKKLTDMVMSWPAYTYPTLPPSFTEGDMRVDQASRIGGYRPRILSPNTPRNSVTMYSVDKSSSLSKVKGDASTIIESPRNYHPSSPRRSNHQLLSSPLYSNGTRANGHVLVPISLAARHYGMAPDFYDARATPSSTMMPIRPYQIGEDFIETEYYPDVLFESASKQQTHVSPYERVERSNRGVAPHQSVNSHKSQSQSNDPDDANNNNNDETEHNKNDDEIKPSDSDSKRSEGSTGDKTKENPNENANTSNDSQYKVIKKHHGHVKMPEWMARDYEEAENSIEVEEERTAAQDEGHGDETSTQQPGMVSVMVGDYTPRDAIAPGPSDSTKAGVTSWSSTVEESTTSIIQDYSSTNYIKDFTILDYIDPLPPLDDPLLPPLPPPPPEIDYSEEDDIEPTSPRGNQMDDLVADNTNTTSNTYYANDANDQENNDEAEKAMKERKAAVLQQIRQKVNESAEQMPPAFTSTPRVVPEADPVPPPPAPPPPLPGNDYAVSRRQRPENEGSLDELPPALGDTRL